MSKGMLIGGSVTGVKIKNGSHMVLSIQTPAIHKMENRFFGIHVQLDVRDHEADPSRLLLMAKSSIEESCQYLSTDSQKEWWKAKANEELRRLVDAS